MQKRDFLPMARKKPTPQQFINSLINNARKILSGPPKKEVENTKNESNFFVKILEDIGILKKKEVEQPKPEKKKKQKESAEQKAFREDAGLSKKEFDKQAAKLKKEMKAEKKRAKDIDSEGEVKNGQVWASTKNGNTYADNLKDAKRYYKHLREVKKMPTLKQADAWLKRIGGAGREYFAIVREKTAKGQTIYKIYDTRSPKERQRRQNAKAGKDNGVARAQQIKGGKKWKRF